MDLHNRIFNVLYASKLIINCFSQNNTFSKIKHLENYTKYYEYNVTDLYGN